MRVQVHVLTSMTGLLNRSCSDGMTGLLHETEYCGCYSIGSDNGLAPARRQVIIWTNDNYFIDAYTRHSATIG